MPLKSPFFWYEDGILARLCAAALAPLSIFYLAGHKLNTAIKTPYKSKVPTICVGNLVAGGSGKTPVALSLIQLVFDNNLAQNPCFLSRGYGGNNEKPLIVERHKHKSEEVGDEPLLLARKAPTIVSRNRKDGVETAEKHGHRLIIMDDGLQNPSIAPDISILVVDGHSGFGNGLPIPAGPLRETIRDGLAEIDACVIIGNDRHGIGQILPQKLPLFEAHLEIDDAWLVDPKSRYIAFCGLGRPEKFRSTILQAGLDLVGFQSFPDHHPYTENDLQNLDRAATENNARLLTTAKDAVRIPASFKWSNALDIMPVNLVWKDPQKVISFLTNKLSTISL